jgi:hypothetical protein
MKILNFNETDQGRRLKKERADTFKALVDTGVPEDVATDIVTATRGSGTRAALAANRVGADTTEAYYRGMRAELNYQLKLWRNEKRKVRETRKRAEIVDRISAQDVLLGPVNGLAVFHDRFKETRPSSRETTTECATLLFIPDERLYEHYYIPLCIEEARRLHQWLGTYRQYKRNLQYTPDEDRFFCDVLDLASVAEASVSIWGQEADMAQLMIYAQPGNYSPTHYIDLSDEAVSILHHWLELFLIRYD